MRNRLIGVIRTIFSSKKRVAIATLAIALVVFAITRLSAGDKTEVQRQTTTAEYGTIISSVSASGAVISTDTYEVTTQATGVVKAVYVTEGEEVYKGQKIAEVTLDANGAQQNAASWSSYLSAQNGANSANNTYRSSQASLAVVYDEVSGHDTDETLEMKEKRTKAEVANDNAYDNVRTSQAKFVAAALDYKQSSPVITASNAGTVTSISISPGMSLTGETAIRVAAIKAEGTPIVSVSVSEIDVPNVQIGQKATITVDSIPDTTFTGEVVGIDRLGSSTSGVTSYPALIKLDTSSDKILPNMSVSANIAIERKTNVLVIPASAVSGTGDTNTVTILSNNIEQIVPVETGISSDTQIEIISGISEGDEVVTGTISGNSNQNGSSFSSFGTGGFGGNVRFSPR